MISWKNGRSLVSDATCPDTFAPSYHCHATSSAGAVATLAEDRKTSKYSCLVPSQSFTPVAIESLGSRGGKKLAFPKELSQRVQQRIGKVRAYAYLLQHLSVAIQRGNALSVAESEGCFLGGEPFCVQCNNYYCSNKFCYLVVYYYLRICLICAFVLFIIIINSCFVVSLFIVICEFVLLTITVRNMHQ